MNLIGSHIGSYVVEKELGAGGTGTVYLGRHLMIERQVAIKVLHDEQAMDVDQVARFFQEAKAAAEIGHPNIITIIDFGSIDTPGGPRSYLMMEALHGHSLDKRLRRGPGLALSEIHHILEQCCSALIASHGKGIIHRDLKPSNVFLCELAFDPLFVKVLDFGTAKLTTPDPSARRTQFGMVLGTPEYMSPEQCEGRGAIDHRSDIYSLGVMIYEMLTGTLPFSGSVREILVAHMSDTPIAPRVRNPAIPLEWEALCLRMMEKAKTARLQSMVEVSHALNDLRGHAAAYEAYCAARTATGHSGHTMQMMVDRAVDNRPTLATAAPTASEPPTQTTVCEALFQSQPLIAALGQRPPAHWYPVVELGQTAGIAAPVPHTLHATWMEHPHYDPQWITVLFFDVASGWNRVAVLGRPT